MAIRDVSRFAAMFDALVKESFGPVVQAECDRIIRYAVEDAKRTIERQMLELTRDLRVRMERIVNQFDKAGVKLEVSISVPKEWEERYGKDHTKE